MLFRSSAVAAYYYLRILVVMYFHEPGEPVVSLPAPVPSLKIAMWACAAGTLALGVFPSLILNFITASSAALLR